MRAAGEMHAAKERGARTNVCFLCEEPKIPPLRGLRTAPEDRIGEILRAGRRFLDTLDRLDRRGVPGVVVGWWFSFGA